jgi:hypothetical protein
MKLRVWMGYTAAGVTVALAALTPFLLMGTFAKGVAALGLHVDEMYSGGPVAQTIPRDGYSITVHREVRPHLLQTESAFVQMDWSPVKALPAHVSDLVDINGDGQPDVRVTFDVPKDAKAMLRMDVAPVDLRYAEIKNAGKEHFSRLIARVDDAIVVRVPVR